MSAMDFSISGRAAPSHNSNDMGIDGTSNRKRTFDQTQELEAGTKLERVIKIARRTTANCTSLGSGMLSSFNAMRELASVLTQAQHDPETNQLTQRHGGIMGFAQYLMAYIKATPEEQAQHDPVGIKGAIQHSNWFE